MRNPALWLGLATLIGPFLMTASLFVPVAALLLGVGLQFEHKGKGVAVGTWVSGLAAVILAVLIYPAHFGAVDACNAIAAGDDLTWQEKLVRDPDDTRLDMLEAGCDDLPFYTMPS